MFNIEKELINFEKIGKWIYTVKLNIEDNAVNFKFSELTKGWKIETNQES